MIKHNQEIVGTHFETSEQKLILWRLVSNLLIVYLILHNLLIPFIINVVKGQHLLQDIHWWFIFVAGTSHLLNKDEMRAQPLIIIGTLGSFIRLLDETYHHQGIPMSWGLFSIYISELSTFIFYYLRFKKFVFNPGHLPLLLMSLMPLALRYIETQGELFQKNMIKPRTIVQDQTWFIAGCRGSKGIFNPSKKHVVNIESIIKECGFKDNNIFHTGKIIITNQRTHIVQLRLHKLMFERHQIKDVFVKLILIKPGTSMEVELESEFYILKSIQQKNLGIQLLAPQNSSLVQEIEFNPYEVKYAKP